MAIEARGAPTRPASVAMSTMARPVPRTPSGTIARADSHDHVESCSCQSPRGSTSRSATSCARSTTGGGAVLLLERDGEVRGEPVEDHGPERQEGPERRVRAGLELGDEDEHDADEAEADTGQLASARQTAKQVRGPGHREDGHGPVDHAGYARVDPLLGDREEGQRDGRPDDPEERDAAPVLAIHRRPRPGEERQRGRAQADSRQRDDAGREGPQTHLHEQEGTAPDECDGGEQTPVR